MASRTEAAVVAVAALGFGGVAVPERAAAQPEVTVHAEPGLRLFYEVGLGLAHQPVCEAPCVARLSPGAYRFHAAAYDGTPFESSSFTHVTGAGTLDVSIHRRSGTRAFGFVLLGVMPSVAAVAWMPFVDLEGNVSVGPLVATELACTVGMIGGLVMVTRRSGMTIRFIPTLDLRR